MTDWFYKATPTKVSFDDTRDLALIDGFLCRSAHDERGGRADNTQHVNFADLIHFYFTGGGSPKVIGTFQVIGPNKHPDPSRFGRGVRGTRLFEVADPVFELKLRTLAGKDGYEPDPVLKKMTGWILMHRADVPTPSYDLAPFYAQATLVRSR